MNAQSIIAGLSLVVALSSCNQPTQPIIEYIPPTVIGTLEAQPSTSLMTRAFLANLPALRAKLSQKVAPVNVIVVRDNGLKTYLKNKNLSEEQFMNDPKLLSFLESHILNERFKNDGVYVSASGVKWSVAGLNVDLPGSINGVPVAGCSVALTPPDAPMFGQVCYVDSPIVPLE